MEDTISGLLDSLSEEDMTALRSAAGSLLGGSEENSADMEMLMKAKELMNQMNRRQSSSVALITALKPYLNTARRGRADQTIRMLRMMEILPMIKELF